MCNKLVLYDAPMKPHLFIRKQNLLTLIWKPEKKPKAATKVILTSHQELQNNFVQSPQLYSHQRCEKQQVSNQTWQTENDC